MRRSRLIATTVLAAVVTVIGFADSAMANGIWLG
jgi:hypothetical protein